MPATDRVKQILSWYGSDNPGTKTNLYRMLMHGQLAGTGKMVILPVDQGFEHGPARTFAPNPAGYDPDYHFQLAIDAGCNAYAAPLGQLEQAVDKFAGQVPLILKLNNSDTLAKIDQPCSAMTGSVEDALRLGACAIGYTIYPGSGHRNTMYQDLRELTLEAKTKGLVVVALVVPTRRRPVEGRRDRPSTSPPTRRISRRSWAPTSIKVKPPTAHIEQAEAKKVFEKSAIPTKTLADRVRHGVQSAFNGKRILIFSGGEARDTASLLADVKELAAGGAFGPSWAATPSSGRSRTRSASCSRSSTSTKPRRRRRDPRPSRSRRPCSPRAPRRTSGGPWRRSRSSSARGRRRRWPRPSSCARPRVARRFERIGPGGTDSPSSTRRWQGGRRCCSSTRGR